MKRIFLVWIICLSLSPATYAAISTIVASEKGPSISNAIITVQDDKYNYMVSNPALWPKEFSNKAVTARITLKYTGEAKKIYADIWNLTVNFTLKSWNQAGTPLPDVSGSLTVGYDPDAGASYKDIDVFAIPNAYKTKLTVGTVTPASPLSAIPQDVVIESSIETERYYKLTQNTSVTMSAIKDLYTNTLELNWPFITGAEEYDLEWVFVSNSRLTKQPVTIPAIEFENATRISTTKNTYKMNLVYDAGILYFRVRGVGRKGSDFKLRQEGTWSNIGNITYDEFGHNRNWTYEASYAEDGKSREVVSFFDGSGRNRQSLTKLNTENTLLATETMYDFEGRPGIQTLPAPINDFKDQNGAETGNRINRLDFYKNYSVNIAGLEFSSKDFDNDALFSSVDCKSTGGNPMDSIQGASNYYSAANKDKNDRFNAVLPAANNYPYTQTVYDKEGKVKMQSSPGVTHKIGSGHESQYFNANVTQSRLDRLFGNDVGYASHYSQKAVMDANGQLSVSYVDLSGKVIASFLTGENTTNLDDLPGTGDSTISENFTSLNALSATEEALVIDAKLLVTSLAPYTFVYELDDEHYQTLCNDTIYNCTYDLLITIYDECDQPVLDASGNVLYQLFTITGAVTKNFTVNFPRKGIYKVRKKLTLNQEALDEAVADFKSRLPGSCITHLSDIISEYHSSVNLDECNPSPCEQACIDAANIEFPSEAGSIPWLNYIANCKLQNNCDGNPKSECDGLLDRLARDLSPEGQYFENLHTNDPQGPDQWLNGNVWYFCDMNAWQVANFRDKSGALITSWDGLRTNWQKGFAYKRFDGTPGTAGCPNATINMADTTVAGKKRLVEFHPEYCHYQWCIALRPSTEFDLKLLSINTYDQALHYPAAAPFAAPTPTPVGKNIVDADPYFNGSGPGISEKATMMSYLSAMWTEAQTEGGCSNCNEQWEVFKAFYIAKKGRLVYEHKAAATCYYLCDKSSPPDNIADADCDVHTGSSVINYTIRVPYPLLLADPQPDKDSAYYHNLLVYVYTNDIYHCGSSSAFVPEGGEAAESTASPCIVEHHCLCDQFTNYWKIYNHVDPLTNQHVVDTANITFATYVAMNLNRDYNFIRADLDTVCSDTITGEAIAPYIQACINSNNQNPQPAWLLPNDLLTGGVGPCGNNPYEIFNCTQPPKCEKEPYTITDYYANLEYAEKFNKEVENFIAGYKQKCLHLGLEKFEASHIGREYQYTLYYYDRAGNLERTVPPEGVRFLDTDGIEQTKRFRNNEVGVSAVYPSHLLVTRYRYNTFNQIVYQNTPDAGSSYYYYNNVGQLRFSANAQQLSEATPFSPAPFSYTKYDGQGRVIEAGESIQYPPMVDPEESGPVTIYSLDLAVNNANFPTTNKREVTKTRYDAPLSYYIKNQFPGTQRNLRSRVAAISYEDEDDGNDTTSYGNATHYSYDTHGNVNVLLQENKDLALIGESIKKVEYDYDLVSGNVNQVSYQRGAKDQFYHRYSYDDDNRIKSVFTSNDGLNWTNDAKYYYYLHGPLARLELGDKKVQGIDYAYTLQGWLKGINSNNLDPSIEIGKDGIMSSNYDQNQPDIHSNVARDVFGYTLHYFTGDYRAIGSNGKSFLTNVNAINQPSNDLFNGNIKMKANALTGLNNHGEPVPMPVMASHYRYDQLNRITTASNEIAVNGDFSVASVVNDYNSSYTYDGNGNILTLNRNGKAGKLEMDVLNYSYDYIDGDVSKGLQSNKLLNVNDNPGYTSAYNDDIDDQAGFDYSDESTWNYHYDRIGNLIRDKQEGIASIEWTVFGKIKKITRVPGFTKLNEDGDPIEPGDLEFAYDASGNRIMKTVKPRSGGTPSNEDQWISTYYVRDAQGNVLATYDRQYTSLGSDNYGETFKIKENSLYGSSRLGIYRNPASGISRTFLANISSTTHKFETRTYASLPAVDPCLDPVCPQRYDRQLGLKGYELADHLGNVVSVISDSPIPIDEFGLDGIAESYQAHVESTSDYYPFGSQMPGRKFNESDYRYGFNGKENDNEVKGSGNQQDFGMRAYDSRLGKWLATDPLQAKYASKTPYSFCSDNPINRVDPDGRDDFHFYTLTTSIWLPNPNAGMGERRKTCMSTISWYTVVQTNTPNTYTYHGLQNVYGEKGMLETTTILRGANAGNAIIDYGVDALPEYQIIKDNSALASFRPYTYSDAADIQNLASYARKKNFENKVNNVMLGLVIGVASEGILAEVSMGGSALEIATAAKTGGRLGNAATRSQIDNIATTLESRGYTITGGGGRTAEEFLKPLGGGRKGGSFLDITATHPNYPTLRINTVDVYKNGLPTLRELNNAARIRTQIAPGEHLLLIPKR